MMNVNSLPPLPNSPPSVRGKYHTEQQTKTAKCYIIEKWLISKCSAVLRGGGGAGGGRWSMEYFNSENGWLWNLSLSLSPLSPLPLSNNFRAAVFWPHSTVLVRSLNTCNMGMDVIRILGRLMISFPHGGMITQCTSVKIKKLKN